MARCFLGRRAIAARTSAARSPRSSASAGLSARLIRDPSSASTAAFDLRAALRASRLRQTLTPIRYSQVAERRLPLEPCERAIRADEDILREIAGVFVVADEPVTELVDLPLVPLDDDVEGVAVPCDARGDKDVVRRVGERRLVRALSVRSRRAVTFHSGRTGGEVHVRVSMPHEIRPDARAKVTPKPALTFAFLLRIVRPCCH